MVFRQRFHCTAILWSEFDSVSTVLQSYGPSSTAFPLYCTATKWSFDSVSTVPAISWSFDSVSTVL